MSDDIRRRVQPEFKRQANQMAAAPAFRTEVVLERFIRAVGDSPSARLLDVACGPGIVAEALAPHVREVVGIDATPEMIRLAQERFAEAARMNGQFAVASAESLPFADGVFDRVMTRLSFHHFQDVNVVLKEMRRALRQGGRLIVSDIISVDDEEQAALHNSVERLRDPSHIRFLPRAELISRIEAAGFSVIDQDSWAQGRSFDEWAAIVGDPLRTAPLKNVMSALARAGQGCGMSLREEDDELRFTHTWLMTIARLD